MKQKIIYLAILAFTFATQAMAQGFNARKGNRPGQQPG